jgi:hypothetical protein
MEILKLVFLMVVALSTTLFCLISFDEADLLIPQSNDLSDWIVAVGCVVLTFFCAIIVTGLLAIAIY